MFYNKIDKVKQNGNVFCVSHVCYDNSLYASNKLFIKILLLSLGNISSLALRLKRNLNKELVSNLNILSINTKYFEEIIFRQ